MRAILSDVHGNLEALHAVLDDIARHPVRDVYCLGDTLGYGPNPCECLHLVARVCAVALLGNHDQAALFDPDGFGLAARRALFWTRERLEAPVPDRAAALRRCAFLTDLPRCHREGEHQYVHGSPRNPLHDYVFPEDIYNQRKMDRLFALIDRCCFQGHTHVPGVFTEQGPGQATFLSPEETDHVHRLGAGKALVNVGSVGQPRDGDPRACYVLLDGDVVRFRRVEYDLETTVRKIYAIDELENFLGDRLRDGR
jgi:diadenosine tetraphosphatase ApaH/serine/threonine PP2A family protein phosphatase